MSVCSLCGSVLTGSPASRPAYLICGFVVAFDFVSPIAMFPVRSTARLGMKRKNVFAPSGSKVAPWVRLAAMVPPVTLAWYQRIVALFEFVPPQLAIGNSPRLTVWSTQSDSVPPMFEYWAWAIARIESVSAALAGVAAFATAEFGQHVGAACVVGPVNVDVDGLSQSTWNL